MILMAKVILVTSGKGGVGKTTVSANLGYALSYLGKRVALVEGDIGLNNLDVALNAEDRIVYDAGDVATGRASVAQCLIGINENLFFFPSATAAVNLITTEVFLRVVRELKRNFDYVLIDSPAGLEENFHRAAVGAESALIVTTPHISAIRDGAKTVKKLYSYGIRECGLVVNRVNGEEVLAKRQLSPEEIAEVTEIPLWGVLPEDDFVNKYTIADSLNKHTDIGMSYSFIADILNGGERKIYDCVSPYSGFFNKLKRWIYK